ncbi:MAG: hypothetical protein KGD58_05675 [Candidatus Lokiarchaeota archaeon]|nr:hypothetical protein [Candidatus Lokiarchaeota archaeon]
MKELKKGDSEEKMELAHILSDLRSQGNFTGVFLAKRDGELIDENVENFIDSKELVSMCASVLVGATELSETMGNQQVNKIIAELNEETIFIVKVNKNSFLICILNAQSNSRLIVENLEEYIQKIKSTLL